MRKPILLKCSTVLREQRAIYGRIRCGGSATVNGLINTIYYRFQRDMEAGLVDTRATFASVVVLPEN
jgi:hypothetical protein